MKWNNGICGNPSYVSSRFFRHFAKKLSTGQLRAVRPRPNHSSLALGIVKPLIMIKSMEARLLVTQTTDGENPSPTWDVKDIESTTMCMQVYMHCLYIRLPVNSQPTSRPGPCPSRPHLNLPRLLGSCSRLGWIPNILEMSPSNLNGNTVLYVI